MEKTKILSARETALVTLLRCEKSGAYSNIALDNALKKSELSESDRALAAILFYGVIERKITLDYIIERLSSRPLGEIDNEVLEIIRLGIYQLHFLDRIPPHAAINETVSLAAKKSRGFVNALLREYTRRGKDIEFPDVVADAAKALSIKHSVGLPLVKKLIDVYSVERADSILSAFSRGGATTLRTNTLLVDRDLLCQKLSGEKTALSPYGIKVKGQITALEGFSDGLFFVQDEASQIASAALGANAGETIIDVCSCPGSKSFGAAIDMKNEGKVYSFDLHENKLSLVRDSAERLHINIIETEPRDAREPREDLLCKADRVICDVPCSGFGVLGKKPELRYKDPEASSALPAIQYDILSSSVRYLKRGGVLVYSTCTIFPEENENNVTKFLSENEEFELEPFSVGNYNCDKGMATFLPDREGTDGFFVARLKKKD